MHISVLQEHAYDQEKVAHLVQNCHTSVELLREMCKVYAERPMHGFCEPGSCQWQTITYKQAYQRVEHLAAGAWAAHLPMLSLDCIICHPRSPVQLCAVIHII